MRGTIKKSKLGLEGGTTGGWGEVDKHQSCPYLPEGLTEFGHFSISLGQDTVVV